MAAGETALAGHRQAFAARQETLRQVDDELRRQQEALQQAQAGAFAAAQELTRVRNEITALDLQKQGNLARLEKLSAEKIQLEEERGRLEVRLREFEASVTAEKLSAQTQRGTVEQRQERLRQVREELERAAREQDQVLEQQAAKRSRLHVLEQLQADHEGFSAGSLAALRQSRHVLGSLVDRIRVPDQYVAAIEAALGHHLQLVLTEQPESARQILAELNTNKAGRASVVPLAFMGPEGNGGGGVAGIAPAALNGRRCGAGGGRERAFQSARIQACWSTRLVPDLDAATAAWRETNGQFQYVTLGGELLSSHGVYTGGYNNGFSDGKAPGSLLGRKNQIAELQSGLAALQEQVAEISRNKGALKSEQDELEEGLQQAQTELRAREVAIATHEGEFNALGNSQRVLQQKIDTVVYEIQSLAAQEDEGGRKRAELTAQAGAGEGLAQSCQARVQELAAHLEALRQKRDQANADLTESRVALAAGEQVYASFQQQQRSLEQRIGELTQVIEQRRAELSSFVGRREQAESEIQESRGLMDGCGATASK